MDRKFYIIHSSEIIQKGLTEILRKGFRYSIECFNIPAEFIENVTHSNEHAIILCEECMFNGEDTIELPKEDFHLAYFKIIRDYFDANNERNQYDIYISDGAKDICSRIEQVIEILDNQEVKAEGLTSREIDVLKLVALGHANKEIADKLFISIHTVMSHRKNLTEKLGIKSISGLTVYAIINNYIDTDNIDVNDLI